jgi:PH (Pleckstrin Homology) domain-containing protein
MNTKSETFRQWSPAAGLVALAWVSAAAAVGWCALLVVTGADPAGRLLSGIAALGLALAALYGTRARPRLRVDANGLTVGGLAGARHHPWPQVHGVRTLAVRRFGLRSTLLEVDVADAAGERLLVFGRLDLGDDPEDVAEAVSRVRPRSP